MDNQTSSMEYQTDFKTRSGDYYVFHSNKDRQYVNMKTGNIERADFYDSSLGKSSQITISQDAALKIATTYVTTHYQNFTAKRMQLADAALLDHGITKEYQFVWRQVIGDVITPNFVLVQINPDSGKVNSYIGISREIEVPVKPAVSQEESVAIASKAFPTINATAINAELGVDYPEKDTQKLLWVIKIQGKSDDNVMQGGMVVIDAQTGYIYSMST
jgi:hypothetical protein